MTIRLITLGRICALLAIFVVSCLSFANDKDQLLLNYHKSTDLEKVQMIRGLRLQSSQIITPNDRFSMGGETPYLKYGVIYRWAATANYVEVRLEAVTALANSVHPEDLKVLSERLFDDDWRVRELAAKQLINTLSNFRKLAPVKSGSNSDGPWAFQIDIQKVIFTNISLALNNPKAKNIRNDLISFLNHRLTIDEAILAFSGQYFELHSLETQEFFARLRAVPDIQLDKHLTAVTSKDYLFLRISPLEYLHYACARYSKHQESVEASAAWLTNAIFYNGNLIVPKILQLFKDQERWTDDYFKQLLKVYHKVTSASPRSGVKETLEAHEQKIGKRAFIRKLKKFMSSGPDYESKDPKAAGYQIGALEYLYEHGYMDREAFLILFSAPVSYRYDNFESYTKNTRDFDKQGVEMINRFKPTDAEIIGALLKSPSPDIRLLDFLNILSREQEQNVRILMQRQPGLAKAMGLMGQGISKVRGAISDVLVICDKVLGN